ncbi:unnamed protein product [Mortierella alpina]
MPALVCSASVSESRTVTGGDVKKRHYQQLHPGYRTIFDLPELCDLIARHLDSHTLTIVLRVCLQWYGSWSRHLWRRARVESGSGPSAAMVNAFPRLSHHIRQLEWIHLDDSTISLQSADLSKLNVQSLLLSSWSVELNERTLARFVRSSANRLSALQLHNMARIRGDLLGVATSLPNLQHLYLTMADNVSRHHPRQRAHHSPTLPSSAELDPASPSSGPLAVLDRVTPASELAVTSADSLPALLDACPRLRTIELRGLSAPIHSTAAVANLGSDRDDSAPRPTASSPLTAMRHLTIVNLHATSISGLTLSVLFARCPRLVKLDLGQTSPLYLSDLHLDPHLSMSALSTLVLSDCHFLDGHGYKEIFRASPSLMMLEIPKTNVDDSALAVLGHHCQQLMDLNLDGCLQITDQGIRDMLSHRPRTSKDMPHRQKTGADVTPQGPYQNHHLQCLTVSNCTELTGQGIHHILMTCAGLRNLELQQPEIMPESLFPHTLETDEDEAQPNPSAPAIHATHNAIPEEGGTASPTVSIYPTATTETDDNANDDIVSSSPPWACSATLETLRIKNLNVINQEQTRFLNARLRELSQLKVLHIGGSQLELSVLNGLGHQLENLYIDDLAREVDLEDVRWLVDHTPNLTRLWCRQLIRHSEPWKLLRGARKHLKLW